MTPTPGAAGAAGLRLSALPYAGLQLRVVAFLLDVMVLISCGMLFAAAAGAYLVVDSGFNDGNLSDRAPYVAVGIFLAYLFLFLPLYHVVLWTRWGQTVGMMAVRIKVISAGGGPLTTGQAAVRLLGYAASMLPLFLGVLIALFDGQRRALHDRLAGTVVVELP